MNTTEGNLNVCLTILIGLPGCGKTCFARTLKDCYNYFQGKYFNFIHVCYDELLPQIDFQKFQENEIKWKDLRTGILNEIHLLLLSIKQNNLEICPRKFKDQLKTSLPDSVTTIIIDDNMYLKSMRYAFYKKAKEFNVSYCQVYLKCSLEQSIERNFSRSHKDIVPLDVINEMNRKIEPPNSDNKWEKHSLIFAVDNDNNELFNDYFALLYKSLENPECSDNEDGTVQRQKSILTCMTNVLHQSDIAVRQIINGKIEQFLLRTKNKTELQKYCAELKIKKGKILNGIKSGAITPPMEVLDEIKCNALVEKHYLKMFMSQLLETYT